MDDNAYVELQVAAAIAPQSANWPRPDFSGVTISGDLPHVPAGDLHWGLIHDAVDEARTRVLRCMGAISAINEDQSLSSVGKEEKKQATALRAIAELEKSKTLTKARDAVERRVKEWDRELGLNPKAPETIADAMIAAEIRSHIAGLKPGERLAFIDSHATEVGSAVLTGPSFLSGLTPAEVDIVKQRVAARTNPEIAKAKRDALDAISGTEKGWRSADRQLRELGGLKRREDN